MPRRPCSPQTRTSPAVYLAAPIGPQIAVNVPRVMVMDGATAIASGSTRPVFWPRRSIARPQRRSIKSFSRFLGFAAFSVWALSWGEHRDLCGAANRNPRQRIYVRNLVGTSVAGVIQEPGKDVLVNCFAPWCGHCQRFKPRYQELAKKLSHVQSLVVSQMDCTQNDLGPLRRVVRGYPTIALFPDGRKEDIQLYVGNRSPEDMTKWFHTKVTHAFSDTAPEPPKSEGDSGLLNDDDSNDL